MLPIRALNCVGNVTPVTSTLKIDNAGAILVRINKFNLCLNTYHAWVYLYCHIKCNTVWHNITWRISLVSTIILLQLTYIRNCNQNGIILLICNLIWSSNGCGCYIIYRLTRTWKIVGYWPCNFLFEKF